MSWPKKALIGACAGLCLSFIKLIDANFYITQAANVAFAGYLMCICYVLMSAIGAIFMEEANPQKLLRQSLLIPSVFLAIVQTGNPNATAPSNPAKISPPVNIPELGATLSPLMSRPIETSNLLDDLNSFLFPSAAAQPDTSWNDSTLTGRLAGRQVKIITGKNLEPGVLEGVRQIWGRDSNPPPTFMFIVGKSNDENKAAEAAKSIEGLSATGNNKVSLVRFPGDSSIYLTIGGLMQEKEIYQLQYDIKDKVYSSRFEEADSITQKATQTLLNGQVVDVRGIVVKQ